MTNTTVALRSKVKDVTGALRSRAAIAAGDVIVLQGE